MQSHSHQPQPPAVPPSPQPPPSQPPPNAQWRVQPQTRRNPLLLPLILVSALALVMSGLYVSTFLETGQRGVPLELVADSCTESPFIEVVDEGTAIIIDTVGESSVGAPVGDLSCVLSELEIPASLMNRIEQTRALDGTQTGSWNGYEATWNYHPDDGINMTITIID